MKVDAIVAYGAGGTEEINLVSTRRSLGSGACGHVIEAEVSATGERVAVKTVDISFGKAQELEHLKTLKHCNIVKLLYHFSTGNGSQKLQYIVMERLPLSLLHMYHRPPKLSMFEIRLYVYQLLRSVAYIHNKGICHRDIKPGNILINPRTGVLKLCDFGVSKYLTTLNARHSTRVGTPQYMAPELLLGFRNYTDSIDVWAIGCIFVELLNGKEQLFRRQSTSADQLQTMIDVFGTPTKQLFPGMIPPYPFEDLPLERSKRWTEIILHYPISYDAVSLFRGLLCYSPSSRLLPHRALGHKYFDLLRSPETKCLANGNPLPPLFNFQPGEFPGDFNHLIPPHLNLTEAKEKDD